MGYLIRTKSNAEKSGICEYLRRMGLSQRPTPFRTKGEAMNTVCVFADHFYSAHWEDADAFMEGEEMVQILFRDYQSLNNDRI